MESKRNFGRHARPLVALLAIFAILLMGVYPAVLAVIDQEFNPVGADGSPMLCNGTVVGSKLVAQNISSPLFFHPRNASASASGIDPDIPPAAAYAQVASVANATGIAASSLDFLIQQNINANSAENWFFAPDYVDVNALNLMLIHLYPTVYAGFCSAQTS
jgi:potassium-transporting ATPase KdpC subunit